MWLKTKLLWFDLSGVHLVIVWLYKTIINHSQIHHFDGWYKPAKMEGFSIVLTTLHGNKT